MPFRFSAGPLRVAVLYGGKSSEREISLASGIAVAAALAEAGHSVRAIDPAEIDLRDVDWRAFDIAYIALHGAAGEDGRVQALLEALGVAYTGSGPEACRATMSKRATKERLLAAGLPTPRYITLSASEPWPAALRRIERLEFPVVIKPDGQGSSLGVGLARNADEAQLRLAESLLYESTVLVEKFLPGREFTVAVVDRCPLPLLEIHAGEALFSFDAKYHRDATEYNLSDELPGRVARELSRLAVAACEALGTAGLARVDLRCDEELRPYVLEINTSPGMTVRSLVPRAARALDMTMAELCDSVLRQALVA